MNEKERLEALLKENGIDQTPEAVMARFQGDETLCVLIQGEEDIDAIYKVIADHLAEYNDIIELENPKASDPTEGRPNEIQATDTPKKKEKLGRAYYADLPEVMNSAIEMSYEERYEEREIIAARTKVTSLLMDKEHPSTYIDVNKVPLKKEGSATLKDIESKTHKGVPVAALLAKKEAFIPTNEQLAELVTLWQAKDPKKRTNTTPAWAGVNNEKRVAAVTKEITDKSMAMKPFISVKDDTEDPHGGSVLKKWRPNIKGVTLSTPATAAGNAENIEVTFAKPELVTWLSQNVNGHTEANAELGDVQLLLHRVKAKPKAGDKASEGSMRGSSPVVSALTIKNKSNAPDTAYKAVQEVSKDKAPMILRSDEWYLVVSVNQSDSSRWNVRKQRVSLEWKDAPKFVVKSQFMDKFGRNTSKGGSSVKALNEAYEASKLVGMMYAANKGEYMDMFTGSDPSTLKGFNEMVMKATAQVNAQTKEAAAALSL